MAGASGDGAAAFAVMELNEQRGSLEAAPSARSAELSGERACPGDGEMTGDGGVADGVSQGECWDSNYKRQEESCWLMHKNLSKQS